MEERNCKNCGVSDVNCYFQCLPMNHPCRMCSYGHAPPLECVRCEKTQARNKHIETQAAQKALQEQEKE